MAKRYKSALQAKYRTGTRDMGSRSTIRNRVPVTRARNRYTSASTRSTNNWPLTQPESNVAEQGTGRPQRTVGPNASMQGRRRTLGQKREPGPSGP